MANPVFVAPHFDDVALSCGATVAMLARKEQPMVVTVFAKNPDSDQDLSSFARIQHNRWGLEDAQVVEQRLAEDRCAASAMGATVQNSYLQFADAIYRDRYYQTDGQLFGDIPVFDRYLIQEISDELAAIDASNYFVPLAIGHHVDHQIVSLVGNVLSGLGLNVYWYEDLPYALTHPLPEFISAQEPAVTVNVDNNAFDKKWAAIACYKSQLPVIFRDIEAPRTQFVQYATSAGGGTLAERFWQI